MLSLCLRPSRILLTWIYVIHSLSLIVVWISTLPWFICLVLDGLILLSGFHTHRKHYWVGDRFLRYRDQCWTLEQGGLHLALTLVGESYLSRWMQVLVFQAEGGDKHSIVILPDSAHREARRGLRVVLQGIA